MSSTEDIEDIFRPFWQQLTTRLQPNALLPWLFEKKLLSYAEMENIQSKPRRREQVNVLLDAIKRRPRADAIAFSRKLARTNGVRELGQNILANAGEDICNVEVEEEFEKSTTPEFDQIHRGVDCKRVVLIGLIFIAATTVLLASSVPSIEIAITCAGVVQEDIDTAETARKHYDTQLEISITSFKFPSQLKVSIQTYTCHSSDSKSKEESRHKAYKVEEQTHMKKSEDTKDMQKQH